MRPLAHLGIGADSPDYDLYIKSESLYDELSDRSDKLLEEAENAFLGDYANLPSLTRSELEKKLNQKMKDKKALIEKFNAPESVIKEYDDIIIDIYDRIKNRDYAYPNDPVHKQYCAERENRLEQFYSSDSYKKLLSEIQEYNEKKYRDLLEEN